MLLADRDELIGTKIDFRYAKLDKMIVSLLAKESAGLAELLGFARVKHTCYGKPKFVLGGISADAPGEEPSKEEGEAGGGSPGGAASWGGA